MKLKTALATSASILLLVFVTLAALLINTSDLLGVAARELAQAGESLRVAEELKSRLLVHNRDVFLYSLHQDQARLISRDSQRVKIQKMVQSLDQLIDNDEEHKIVAEVKKEIADYFAKRDELKTSPFSSVERYNHISQYVDDAITAIDRLVEMNHSQMDEQIAAVDSQNRSANRAAVILLSTGSFILLGLIIGIITMIARPLAAFMDVITAYSTGDSAMRAVPRGLWETRRIADTFNLMADRLDEKRRDQLTFIASVAHDLRNPLHSMSMAVAMLLRKGDKASQAPSEVIFRQLTNLDRLVGDLLDTTRIESGQLEMSLRVQDVTALVRDAVELRRNDSALHSFKLEIPTAPLMCDCDGGRISQVMNNLISNAIKYSPNGGVIKVNAWAERHQIYIAIADQGMGIASDDLQKIFEPFQRTQATKDTIPGIGLGLSASRRIVEAHGGKLRAESELHRGSTFLISLPVHTHSQPTDSNGEPLRSSESSASAR